MTTVNQQAELQKPVTRVAYFAEFSFKSGTQRLSSLTQPITWGGNDWQGLGSLGSISEVREDMSLEPQSLTFSLNVVQVSWLALSLGDVGEYRGKRAKLYMCPLNDAFQLVDTPELCWQGYMDIMTTAIDKDSGSISLKCETAAYGLKRRAVLRLNAAVIKARNATETGFDFLVDLIANPQIWLSKKFQQS